LARLGKSRLGDGVVLCLELEDDFVTNGRLDARGVVGETLVFSYFHLDGLCMGAGSSKKGSSKRNETHDDVER
jgi:hypothetical protein